MKVFFLFSFQDVGNWFRDTLQPYLAVFGQAMREFVPKLTGALFLLLLGWLIGKGLAKLVRKLLERMGVDKLAERLNRIELLSKSPIKVKPSAVTAKFLYYIVFFIFFMAAMDVLKITAVSELISGIFSYLPKLISALLVFIIGILLADFLKNIVQTACVSLNIPAAALIGNFVFYFLFINVVMIALSQAGIATSFIEENLSILLIGIVAAFSIGYGYASRPLVSNILAAHYHRKRVKVGAMIEIDGVRGEIVEMDSSCLIIAAPEGRVIIPLNKLSTDKYTLFDRPQ